MVKGKSAANGANSAPSSALSTEPSAVDQKQLSKMNDAFAPKPKTTSDRGDDGGSKNGDKDDNSNKTKPISSGGSSVNTNNNTGANRIAPSSANPVSVAKTTAALNTSAASLHQLSRQQEDYRRQLQQLQHQQYGQWQQNRVNQQQQQKQQLEKLQRQDRMQQIQHKLHERIQLKQQQQLSTEISRVDEGALSQAIAQQQLQQYHALMRDLEQQSGIPMAPGTTPQSIGARTTDPVHNKSTAIATSTTTTTTATAAQKTTLVKGSAAEKAQDEFQRLRQEQLQRLQQYQLQTQQKIQQQHAVAREDLIRQQLLQEQEHLRILQTQEQQNQALLHDNTNLLIQQQEVLRQQQLLHGLLQKQQRDRLLLQQQQQRQQELYRQQQQQRQQPQPKQVQRQQQQVTPQVQPAAKLVVGDTNTVASSATSSSSPPPKKRKKQKSATETQMEALVRLLCRLDVATTDVEVRQGLDKMTAWVHRCFDMGLLKFALRDFDEIVAKRRTALSQTNHWPTDLQVKCEYLKEKMKQLLTAFQIQQREKMKQPQQQPGAASTENNEPLPKDESDAIRIAAREHAYAALKAQMMAAQQQQALKRKEKAAGVTSGKSAATKTPKSTESGANKKRPLYVDLSLVHGGSVKYPDTTKKLKSDGTSQSPLLSATGAHRGSLSATPIAVAGPISPRTVQQLYDVDLTRRKCTVAPDEGDDKFYFPMKSVAKIMRKALPGGTDRKDTSKPTTSIKEQAPDTGVADITTTISNEGDKNTVAVEAENNSGDAKDGVITRSGSERSEKKKPENVDRPPSDVGTRASTPIRSMTSLLRTEQQIKIDDDAVAFMQECATEFLLFLTSEARDHAAMERKKNMSIAANHVLHSLQNLGFTPYAKVLNVYNEKIKAVQDAAAQKKLEKKIQAKQQAQQQLMEAAAAAAAAQTAVSASTSAHASVSVPEAQPPLKDTQVNLENAGAESTQASSNDTNVGANKTDKTTITTSQKLEDKEVANQISMSLQDVNVVNKPQPSSKPSTADAKAL